MLLSYDQQQTADWSKRDHVTLVIIGRCTLERVTVQHVRVAHATCFHNVAHVARLFPKLAENENRTNTSNLRWVDLYLSLIHISEPKRPY